MAGRSAERTTAILGAGVTGLAAGMASGLPVFEAAADAGGICASYYVGARHAASPAPPPDDEAYRFEVGGGHWIFGGEPTVLALLEELAPMRAYERSAAVHLRDPEMWVPYPIQHHAAVLGLAPPPSAAAPAPVDAETMAGWLRATFGPALGARFFEPYHQRYTDGLHREIAPQDGYKSPAGREAAPGRPAGYNPTFRYPVEGLDALVRSMAWRSDVRFRKRVERIDVRARRVRFTDGDSEPFDRVACTLPLSRSVALAGLDVGPPDPHTSVLVVNIGAERGPACPEEHWVYEPHSATGFHRLGAYSNVDASFLPRSARGGNDRVALYVEHVRRGDRPIGDDEAHGLAAATVGELQAMHVIGATEVVDPTIVDVGYTWAWPGSTWRERAIAALAEVGVDQVGRYGRWRFQGIAESVADGLAAGAAARTDP